MRQHRSVFVALVLIACSPRWAAAASLWSEGARSLIADRRAAAVGDVVTIVIVERSSASHQASHETQKNASASGAPGQGLLSFFPELGYRASRATDGAGATRQTTRLVDRISGVVAAVTPEGNLRLEARRKVRINQDELMVTLTGLVRPDDVSPDNTVMSTQIADCELEWSGRGPIPEKQRPGLISALLRWLW